MNDPLIIKHGDADIPPVWRLAGFALGAGNRSETGSTNGTQIVGRLLGGYWFNLSQELIHGPYARLTWQNIKVDSYAESGTSSTAMSVSASRPISLAARRLPSLVVTAILVALATTCALVIT